MDIKVLDYEKPYAENEYENIRIHELLTQSLEDNIRHPNNEFSIRVYNMLGTYGEHNVGDLDNQTYIFINYTDKDAKGKNKTYHNKYGTILPPVGDGVLFIGDDDAIIAEFRDKTPGGATVGTFNILFDLVGTGNLSVFDDLMKEFQERVIDELNNRNSWKKTKDRDRLIELVVERSVKVQEREIQSIKYNISDSESEITKLRERLTRQISRLNNYSRQLADALKHKDGDAKKIENELELIVSNENIKDVIIRQGDEGITVLTNELYIYDSNNKKHYGGEYEIFIDTNTSDIRFYNENGRKSYWTDNDPHPHVNGRDGTPCLGNLSSTVAELCAQNELYALVLMLVDFLQQADLGDFAGGHIVNWDTVDEEGNIIPADPKLLDPQQLEDSNYCDFCNERHNTEEYRVYTDVIRYNEGERYEYYEYQYACEECLEREDIHYIEDEDIYAIDIEDEYEESEYWHACSICGEINHEEYMIDVYNYAKIDEEGNIVGLSHDWEYMCEECLDEHAKNIDDGSYSYYVREIRI